MHSSTLDDLADAYARVSASNQRLLQAFDNLAAHLHQEGVDFILLKGADVLTRLYGAWGLRTFCDIDLLVHEQDLVKLDRLLLGLGFQQEIDGNPAYRSSDGRLLLDIASGIWYLDQTGLEAIWRRSIKRTIQAHPFRCMHTNDLALYLTAYNILHRGSCSPAFAQDLRLLIEREPVNWEVVLDEAVRWNLKIPLYYGFVNASKYEPIPIPQPVLSRLAPSSFSEQILLHMLRRLVTDQPLPNIGHFLLLITRPGGKQLEWIWKYLMPSREFLRYRYGEQGASQPLLTRSFRFVRLFGQAFVLASRMAGRLCSPSWTDERSLRSSSNVHSR
jgi:hypothetical protein